MLDRKTLRCFSLSVLCGLTLMAGCGGGAGAGDTPAPSGTSNPTDPGALYAGGVSPAPVANLPAPVVTGTYKTRHDRTQVTRPASDVLTSGSSIATIPQLTALRVDDTVEFADRVLRIVAVRSPGVYQVEEATPFDVFTKLNVSSRSSASAQRSKDLRDDAAVSALASAATLSRWLTFTTEAAAAAQTVYAVTKEFLDCTTFAAVEVAARPTLHASGAASFSGHEFAAKDCKVYADSTGAITVDQNLALGADGEVTIDPDALTIGFRTEGAYATRTKVTVTASGTDTKSTYRLVNLVPDFLNPASTTDYPETVKTLRKMLSMSVYLDLVLLHEVRGAKASAEFSGAGDFAFGGTATYDKATKQVRFASTTLTNGKSVSADPAKAGVRMGVDQFDGRLGGGLQLGFLVNFAQTTEDTTASWLTNTFGESASSAATSGLSASLSFNARARAGLGVFVDLNVGREVPSNECRFHLKGSLGYESFYAFAYRVGAALDQFQYKDGPLFLFGDNEGIFTIHDFVSSPTPLIDGAKYCGPNSVLQVATEGRPKLVMRNLATGQVHAVDSAGGIAQLARPIPVRDLRNFSFEVDTSAIARYRVAGGIVFAWSSSDPAAVPVSFPTSSQAMLFPICNNACPSSVVATVRVSYGGKAVHLPVSVPVDNYPTPRGRFAVGSAGAVLDASASSDPEGDVVEYQWYSPSGLLERSATRQLTLGANSAFAQDLLSSGRSPTLAVVDNRGQRSLASAVNDPALLPAAAAPVVASAALVSTSPPRLEVIFNQPMNPTYFTTGDYVPSSSVWESPTKFVVNFTSYTPGGRITLKAPTATDARGFRSAAGAPLAQDYVFQFPAAQPPVGSAPAPASLNFVSTVPPRLEVTFDQPMRATFGTTGSYVPTSSVWETTTKFVITFSSFTPGGTITLLASNFVSVAGVPMASDVTYQFPANSGALLARWTFDDCTGADSSGNGRNATLNGGPACVAGRVGNALRFSGIDVLDNVAPQWLELPRNPGPALTFATWFKWEPTTGYRSSGLNESIWAIGDTQSDTGSTGIWISNAASRSLFAYGTNGPAATAVPGVWMHVAFTSDGKVSKLYVNGEYVHEVIHTTPINLTGQPQYISSFERQGFPTLRHVFAGLIDDARSYNRVLSADEVRSLYQGN